MDVEWEQLGSSLMGLEMKSTILAYFAAALSLGLNGLEARAATNDVAFSQCELLLHADKDVLPGIVWHSNPLPQAILKVELPTMFGDRIVRWATLRNANGMKTFVVLARDQSESMRDDPDGIDVIADGPAGISIKQMVGANSVAFTKSKNINVNGLVFCTQQEIGPIWTWRGSNWEVH